jgi:D-alanine-D-alanine ligase
VKASENVGVVFGGPGPEHDVSVLTGLQAERCLNDHGSRATSIYWSKGGEFYDVGPGREAASFREGVPAGSDPLFVGLGSGRGSGRGAERGFSRRRKLGRAVPVTLRAIVVCCHGAPGECGRLQGLLDLMGVPYTGPTQAGAALGMDKLAFAAVAEQAGVSAIPRMDLATADERSLQALGNPLIVKPRYGGSSLGVELVDDLDSVRALARSSPLYVAGALVEPFLKGWFDINIALRSWPTTQLSAIERPLARSGPLLSYQDKYVPEEGMAGAARELPAAVNPEVAATVTTWATAMAKAAGLRGVARLDFMTDGSRVLVNEINTIPGSLARYLWIDPAIPFIRQLSDLIEEAVARPAYRPTLAGADGRLLHNAASVAAKLA